MSTYNTLLYLKTEKIGPKNIEIFNQKEYNIFS